MQQRPKSALGNTSKLNKKFQVNEVPFSTSRHTLVNMLADMPALTLNNQNTTSLLYSKFIVKGIKSNKVNIVKESFKKQNLHKIQLSNRNAIQSTRISSAKPDRLRPKSGRNSTYLYEEGKQYNNDSQFYNLEIGNFYQKTDRKHQNKNEIQRKMTKVESQNILKRESQNILKRPRTATTQPFVNSGKFNRIRPQTASCRKFQNKANYMNFQIQQPKNTVIQSDALKVIELLSPGQINHIQKNKRQLSASSRKTSLYLTGVQTNSKIAPLNQMKKMAAKRHFQKSHSRKCSVPQIQFIREEGLTKDQIQTVRLKQQENTQFMKVNMPIQFPKYRRFLQLQQNNLSQEDNLLLSKDLCQVKNEFDMQVPTKNIIQQQQHEAMQQAIQYNRLYIHACDQTEYKINKTLGKKQQKKITNELIDVISCQKVLELGRQKVRIKSLTPKNQIKEKSAIQQINNKIYQLVAKIQFFRNKKYQICQKIFQLDFQILSHEEGDTIITKGQQILSFFVILNGLVIKQSQMKKQNQFFNQTEDKLNKVLIKTSTYFDGQSFGQPQNPEQTYYGCSFTASQKVLLMKFTFKQYKKLCVENQNIQQKKQMLKNIFLNTSNSKAVKQQHLQIIAFSLESLNFNAKQIIFRDGDICDQLIIVASGKVSLGNEHILKRKKKISKDMKKKVKSTQKISLKNHSVNKLRRNNLKNYEIIKQNQEQFIYYYQETLKQLIKGDTINWQGFYQSQRIILENQDKQDLRNNIPKSLGFKLKYSLVIYLLIVDKYYGQYQNIHFKFEKTSTFARKSQINNYLENILKSKKVKKVREIVKVLKNIKFQKVGYLQTKSLRLTYQKQVKSVNLKSEKIYLTTHEILKPIKTRPKLNLNTSCK